MQYLSFCVWIISHSFMSSGFICVVAFTRTPFLLKAEWYSTICICHILFTHPSTWDRQVASTFWLLWMMIWTQMYKYFFEYLLSILLGIYPEAELQDHVKILCLIFWGTAIMSSIVATPFDIPPSMSQERSYFISLSTFVILVYFLSLVLNCLSLMIHDTEHFFHVPSHYFCIFFREKSV